MGAVAGFNRKEGSWAEGVREATGGNGVTLILDCVGGSYFEDNAAAIAMDGRWVLYGMMGGAGIDVAAPLGLFMRKRIR